METVAQFALMIFIGILIGLLFGYVIAKAFARASLAAPTITINEAPCTSGRITIKGLIDPNNDAYQLRALHVKVYENPAQVVPANPLGVPGVTRYAVTGLPLSHPGGGTSGNDLVAVWGEYTAWTHGSTVAAACSSSGSSHPMPQKMAPRELEAVPREYRVSLGAASGPVSGPAAEVVGALNRAPETVLRYVPEDSSPAEPFWRGLGGTGAIHEVTLRLMHRADGSGAVLRVALLVADQRVELTWVTSDWRPNAASRFVCESDEPGVPALVAAPA